MASVIPEFEYDIFISYRHNDNRSGWVSEFVNALQEELASTIKEPISIYFDKNPHDGLLEMHNVDKSLEGKLKCLVFIPIISQTYCDPKSFAWEHEFRAFNKLAKEDRFGRDIKLTNGNVTSRILPIQIHDLDTEDKSAIQNEIGGVLRSIEFIFKSPGVNRPLQSKDDDAKEITHSVFYRDQINKVANAIKEIVGGLKNAAGASRKQAPLEVNTGNVVLPRPKRKWVVSVILALTLVLSFLGYQKFFGKATSSNVTDKSVAVLAFDDLSPQHDQEWFSDGLTEEILNSLANLQELKVSARTSSFYFKGKKVPLSEISRKLGVAHIVEGSVQKINNRLKVTVQLIRASDEFHIWSEKYERDYSDLFKIQEEIAENIAQKLLREFTPEKKERLITSRPANLEAYEYYLKGFTTHHDKFHASLDHADFQESERFFLKSIALDPSYAETYGALADLYDSRSNADEYRSKYAALRDSVVRVGYNLNPNSVQVLLAYGYSWRKRQEQNIDSSFYFFKKAHDLAPEDPQVNDGLCSFYRNVGLVEKAVKYGFHSVELNPLSATAISELARCQIALGYYSEAKKNCEKAIEINAQQGTAQYFLGLIGAMNGDVKEIKIRLEKLRQINGKDPGLDALLAFQYAVEGKGHEAVNLLPQLRTYSLLGMKEKTLQRMDSLMALKGQDRIYSPDPIGLKNDKMYDLVRNEPQFKIIYDRVVRRHDEMMAKYGNLD